ncbi:MAG: hypothetical protein ACTHJM_03885 [Marmoricola sp.]
MPGTIGRLGRSALGRLPDSTQATARRLRAELSGLGQLKVNQNMLAMRVSALEGRLGTVPAPGPTPPDPRFPDHVRSRLCTQNQMESPWFTGWCQAMGIPPYAHRKQWEFAYIAEVLSTFGMLEPGRRGIGFGVGREPLVSLFASRGVEVMATDLEADAREAIGWIKSGQHAEGGVAGLRRDGVIDLEQLQQLVQWRAVDMSAIPDDLTGYDFTWSACSLEHIGTLQLGLDFIENSLKTLKPGGIAVHTTEFNVNSNEDTIEAGPTVVYRERDMTALRDKLEAAGHEVAAFDFSRGEGLLDKYVDVPPYADEPVLRFQFGPYTLTSVAMVIRKGPA